MESLSSFIKPAGPNSTPFLFCPCETGILITVTEWADFLRMKFTCIWKRCKRVHLRDVLGRADVAKVGAAPLGLSP